MNSQDAQDLLTNLPSQRAQSGTNGATLGQSTLPTESEELYAQAHEALQSARAQQHETDTKRHDVLIEFIDLVRFDRPPYLKLSEFLEASWTLLPQTLADVHYLSSPPSSLRAQFRRAQDDEWGSSSPSKHITLDARLPEVEAKDLVRTLADPLLLVAVLADDPLLALDVVARVCPTLFTSTQPQFEALHSFSQLYASDPAGYALAAQLTGTNSATYTELFETATHHLTLPAYEQLLSTGYFDEALHHDGKGLFIGLVSQSTRAANAAIWDIYEHMQEAESAQSYLIDSMGTGSCSSSYQGNDSYGPAAKTISEVQTHGIEMMRAIGQRLSQTFTRFCALYRIDPTPKGASSWPPYNETPAHASSSSGHHNPLHGFVRQKGIQVVDSHYPYFLSISKATPEAVANNLTRYFFQQFMESFTKFGHSPPAQKILAQFLPHLMEHLPRFIDHGAFPDGATPLSNIMVPRGKTEGAVCATDPHEFLFYELERSKENHSMTAIMGACAPFRENTFSTEEIPLDTVNPYASTYLRALFDHGSLTWSFPMFVSMGLDHPVCLAHRLVTSTGNKKPHHGDSGPMVHLVRFLEQQEIDGTIDWKGDFSWPTSISEDLKSKVIAACRFPSTYSFSTLFSESERKLLSAQHEDLRSQNTLIPLKMNVLAPTLAFVQGYEPQTIIDLFDHCPTSRAQGLVDWGRQMLHTTSIHSPIDLLTAKTPPGSQKKSFSEYWKKMITHERFVSFIESQELAFAIEAQSTRAHPPLPKASTPEPSFNPQQADSILNTKRHSL